MNRYILALALLLTAAEQRTVRFLVDSGKA
jgi:hypothetical protein